MRKMSDGRICFVDDCFSGKKPVYFPIDINFTDRSREVIKQEVLSVDEKLWFYDDYRGVKMLSLFTGGGAFEGKASIERNRDECLEWTKPAEDLKETKKFLIKELFPLLQGMGRVVILRTLPGSKILEHIDCLDTETNQLNPKIRISLSGDISSLYFVGDKKKYIPSKHYLYMIDGAIPHGAQNAFVEDKMTICIGSPWRGELTRKGYSTIKDSLRCYTEDIIYREDIFQSN
jgi:hypothetical protein